MESASHMSLVDMIMSYAESVIPKEYYQLIQIDSAGKNDELCKVNGFIPDLYYSFNDMLVIGEAKTLNDFDRPHSKRQFKAFIDYCKYYSGRSMLLVGVPWQLIPSAKNLFRKTKRDNGLTFDIVIIDEGGEHFLL